MILILLITIPLVAGALAWIFGRQNPLVARWVAFLAMAIDFVLVLALWGKHFA